MLDFDCQRDTLDQLNRLSRSDYHSIVIHGNHGVGKTFLARQYASLLHIPDFKIVPANVGAIREALDISSSNTNNIVLCIENLDDGVVSSAYTMLKTLEEPPQHLYLVLTCSNLKNIPDTIISRSAIVSISYPTNEDIMKHAKNSDTAKYNKYVNQKIWNAVRAFSDVDKIFRFTDVQVEYFNQLYILIRDAKSDSIANLMWRLGHFPDKAEIPIQFMLNYLIYNEDNYIRKRIYMRCSQDIENSRVASHVCIARMLFALKYQV